MVLLEPWASTYKNSAKYCMQWKSGIREGFRREMGMERKGVTKVRGVYIIALKCQMLLLLWHFEEIACINYSSIFIPKILNLSKLFLKFLDLSLLLDIGLEKKYPDIIVCLD